ncbi:MAG: TetR/AcrR family transcriptional regulator, partial [Microthrixaceae bacterium]
MTESTSSARTRLIDAGARVLDELPLAKVIAGATTARIAEAAGVTTGSYFHHFASAAEFADALALSLLQEPHDLSEQVDDMVAALAHLDLFEMLRASLVESWAVQSSDEHLRRALRLQFTMWAHHTQELAHPHGDLRTVADVLRRSYEVRDQDSLLAWQQFLDATNRTFAEPFSAERVVIALTAMHEGLLARQQLDPDKVDDTLFAEVGAMLSLAVTVPTGTRLRLSELATIGDQSALSPQARTGARRRRRTRDRVTRAATGLFGGG